MPGTLCYGRHPPPGAGWWPSWGWHSALLRTSLCAAGTGLMLPRLAVRIAASLVLADVTATWPAR